MNVTVNGAHWNGWRRRQPREHSGFQGSGQVMQGAVHGAHLEIAGEARQPRQAGVAALAAQAGAADCDAADGLQRRFIQGPLQHGAGGQVQGPAVKEASRCVRRQGGEIFLPLPEVGCTRNPEPSTAEELRKRR